MKPQDYALGIYRGDTYHWQFRVWADAAGTVPADLTGVVVAAEIRNAPDGALVVPLPCQITGHVIDMTLDAASSRRVPASGRWDLQLTFPDGEVRTIVAGRVANQLDIVGSTAQVAV